MWVVKRSIVRGRGRDGRRFLDWDLLARRWCSCETDTETGKGGWGGGGGSKGTCIRGLLSFGVAHGMCRCVRRERNISTLNCVWCGVWCRKKLWLILHGGMV